MGAFDYKAVDATGKIIVDIIDSASEQSAKQELFKKGLRPISVSKRKTAGQKESASSSAGSGLFEKPVKTDEIVLFTRELVTLLRAGVPMLTALEALSGQSSQKMGEVVNSIYVDVMSGNSLSQAMDKHPKVFSKLFVNSIKAGEMSGSLDEVLERMASVLKHDEETKKKVKSAMRYPILVIIAMSIAFIIILNMVIPKFALIFEGLGMDLPMATKILLGASRFMQSYILHIIIGLGGLFGAFKLYTQNPKGKYWWDETKMKLPLVGNLITKSAMARFTKMFETLNKSGLPILQTLQTVSGAVGNAAIEKTIQRVAIGVEKGEGIAGSMKRHQLFPPMVVRMISIGEQSGSLDEMLASVAEHYDVEVEYAIKGLTAMIEPILTLVLGGAVIVMAFGIFLPMWNLTGAIQ